jgi:hypothetical protein
VRGPLVNAHVKLVGSIRLVDAYRDETYEPGITIVFRGRLPHEFGQLSSPDTSAKFVICRIV